MSDGDAMERARKLVQEAADSPVVVKARGAVLEATSVPAERTRLLQPLVPLAPEPATSGKNPVDTGWAPFQNALRVDAANSLPDAILPGLAWAERLALLSAPAKAGKSTFISQALEAAATERNFCGLPLVDRVPESVGIITEEPLGLLAQRLRFYGGPDGRGEHVERVWIASPRWDDERILAALERQQPDLVIIDSWTDWAVAAGSETLWNAAEMRLRMLAMREVTDRGAAVLIVHHARKSDGTVRDSGDLTAAVDMVMEFNPISETGMDGRRCQPSSSDLRQVEYRGRWPMDVLELDFDRAARRYRRADGEAVQRGRGYSGVEGPRIPVVS